MPSFDIREWVDQGQDQKPFRETVHIILAAISGSDELRASMAMKGGILLALGYQSSRYTKDIDFSTESTLTGFDKNAFIQQFEEGLVQAVDSLDYGLDCIVQSVKQKPPQEDASFPTIRITVGYAYKSDHRAHKRLLSKNSPQVVQVDYSLNEPTPHTEFLEIEDGLSIQAYTLPELMGEKLRALLQQEERNRFRRQDVYDLYFILEQRPECQLADTKDQILQSLLAKSLARGIDASSSSMDNPEIRNRSEREYGQLAAEVEGELPPFGEIYESVRAFYRSLPWDRTLP